MNQLVRRLAVSGSLVACQPGEPPLAAQAPVATPRTSPTRAGPPQLVPGVALGPFEIGMTRAEFAAAARSHGLMVRDGYTAANAYAGPYFVAFTDPGERMSTILAPFVEVGGVTFAGEVLPPMLTDVKDIAARLRCGDEVLGMGSNFFVCEGGVMVEHGRSGIHVRVQSEAAAKLGSLE